MAFARITVVVAATLIFQISSAQTLSVCNPLKEKCPNNTGLSVRSYAVDFTNSKSTPDNWTVANYENITYGKDGAEFTFQKRHDAPSMWTDFKIWFGRVEVVAQGAPGLGIISSMVLLSDDLDEVDWEMKGTGGNAIGTNYWGKGILDYTNNAYVEVSTPNTAFHTYTLDWSPSSLVWEIDGVAVRNITAAQAGDKYPQSPMKLCLSVWDAGDPSNAAGTIQWAGGVTPFPPPKPYSMFVKSAKITNSNPAAEYEYTDKSGKASSIKVIKNAPVIHSSSIITALHSKSSVSSAATTPNVTTKPMTSSISSTSGKDSVSSIATRSKSSTTTPGHSTKTIIYTSMTVLSQTSVTATNGKTSQQVFSVTSTVYSTSTATIRPMCSSHNLESSGIPSASHSPSNNHQMSSTASSASSSQKFTQSFVSSKLKAGITSSAAPPMAPVLLAAARPTSSKSSTSPASVTTMSSASTTTTFLLTSTSTRTHSLLLWSTNGTSTSAASTGATSGISAGSPTSTTSAIIFTGDGSGLEPLVIWTPCIAAILGALFGHRLYL